MKSVVDMVMIGPPLYINVFVWDRSRQVFRDISLIFDTGATTTIISPGILTELGYNVSNGDVQKIVTGSGTSNVNEVVVDKFKIGDYVLENVNVYAHDFPDESFCPGVIGLNIISQFDVCMYFGKKCIEISQMLNQLEMELVNS